MREPCRQLRFLGPARYLGTGTNVAAIHWMHGVHVPAQTKHFQVGLCAFEHRVSPRLVHLQESVKNKVRLVKESHRDIMCEIFMVIQWLCRGNFAH